jgi:hypothetical protein
VVAARGCCCHHVDNCICVFRNSLKRERERQRLQGIRVLGYLCGLFWSILSGEEFVSCKNGSCCRLFLLFLVERVMRQFVRSAAGEVILW